ncbi:MAG: hypothetical protein HFJ45_02655 [Clostridia bacterium]|nr:hypothetical protein [Clostridia bacterium]
MKKKWIFLEILFIILIIAITAFVSIKVYTANNDNSDSISTSASSKDAIKELELEIQAFYKDSTIYASGDKKILILELKNWDNTENYKINMILNTIKAKMENKEFKTYNKLIEMTYFDEEISDGMKLYQKEIFSLPDLKEEETISFVDFDTYEKDHNSY